MERPEDARCAETLPLQPRRRDGASGAARRNADPGNPGAVCPGPGGGGLSPGAGAAGSRPGAGDQGAYWRPGRIFDGRTVVVVASGPSRRAVDVWRIRRAAAAGRCSIIAVNREAESIPEAEIWYACDARFWRQHDRDFDGLKVGAEPYPGIHLLEITGESGFDPQPGAVRAGGCSGHQATHLAAQLGARRIILYGFDCSVPLHGRRHWFGDHAGDLGNPTPTAAERWRRAFPALFLALSGGEIDIVNCTVETALRCFRRVPLNLLL